MDSVGTLQLNHTISIHFAFLDFELSSRSLVTLVASPDSLQVARFSPGPANASGKTVDHLNGRTNHG